MLVLQSVDSVGGELQPVPEHHAMDFPDPPPQQQQV